MNVICLVVDRLHAAYLGTYGNTWVRTPTIDRLAADGFVFDQVVIDSPRLDSACRSYWLGRHAMSPGDDGDAPTLPDLVDRADMASVLLSDEPAVLRHPLAVEFDEQIAIEPHWEPRVAESLDQTHLGRCFAELSAVLEQMPPGFLIWAHLSGLGMGWDAPLELREMYRDDEDPSPWRSAEVPELELQDGFDPDLLLPINQAYAGQVTLLDLCLAGLLELLDQIPLGRDTAVLLTSPRGIPLGEHRVVGPASGERRTDPLYAEVVQVPLIARLPHAPSRTAESSGASGEGQGGAAIPVEPIGRSQTLVQPSDIFATLAELVGGGPVPTISTDAHSLLPIIRGESSRCRERAGLLGAGGQRGFRTPAWYLRLTDQPELFAKPDDRWEANDVAARCREVVEGLLAELDGFTEAMQSPQGAEFPPLPDILRNGFV